MSNKEKKYFSEIVPVTPWKAFLGFATDFFISFGLLMVGTFFLSPVLQRAFGYDDVAKSMVDVASESSLFHTKSGDTFEISPFFYGLNMDKGLDEHGKIKEAYGGVDETYVGKYPFELYEDILYRYLMGFAYSGDGTLFSPSGIAMTEFSNKIEAGRYIGEIYYKITDSEDSYYRFASDENGNPIYDQKPVHNEKNPTIQGLNDENKTLLSATMLNNFFYTTSSETNGAYEIAITNFVNYEPLYLLRYGQLEYIVFYAKIPVRLGPPLIFILIIPLILRDGKSIGRLLTGSAVIDKGGYCAKKWRILIHQGILFLPWFLGLLPYDILALFSVVTFYLVDFLINNVSPSKRSLHELIAGTITVNDEVSSYFKNIEDLEAYKREAPATEPIKEPLFRETPIRPKAVESKPVETPIEEEIKEEKENAPKSEELDEDDFLDDKKK